MSEWILQETSEKRNLITDVGRHDRCHQIRRRRSGSDNGAGGKEKLEMVEMVKMSADLETTETIANTQLDVIGAPATDTIEATDDHKVPKMIHHMTDTTIDRERSDHRSKIEKLDIETTSQRIKSRERRLDHFHHKKLLSQQTKVDR